MRVFVILSCYFLSGLLFATFCYKAFLLEVLLTFQELQGWSPGSWGCGGHFRELFVCGCLRLSVKEKKRRKRRYEGKGDGNGGEEGLVSV